MQEFRINKYLVLKLVGYNTVLYINDESFIQCKRLVLDIPRAEMDQYSQLDSIDEAAEIYDHTIHDHEVLREGEDPEVENDEYFSLLSPEEEFWGHCSNLEVWAEHDYDTRLLMASLAFPLLEALSKAGDQRARVRIKEEIIERIKSGYKPVIEYLFVEEYIDMLSNEELLYGLLVPEEAEILLELQKQLDIEFKYVPDFRTIYKNIDNPRTRIPIGIVVRKIRNLPNYKTMSRSEIEDAIYDFYNSKRKKYRVFKSEDKKVVGLRLHNCNIEKLPEKLRTLKSLKELDLYKNDIKEVGDILENFPNLKKINLRENPSMSEKNLKKIREKKIEDLHP